MCFGLAMNESVKHGKCYLEVIAVEDGFRGRGMDKALMDRAEQEARARHCKVS